MTVGVGMWDAFKGLDPESEALANAIASTEKEVYLAAWDEPPEDESFNNSLEWQEQFDGTSHPDEYYAQELAGVDHNADAEALRAENARLRQHIDDLTPEPERPDMFADPEAWEENLLAQARGQGGVPLPNYGTNPIPKPDLFADPNGYERWLLGEVDRRSGMEQYHSERVNSSMQNTAEMYRNDFQEAFRAIASLDVRNPGNQALVNQIWNSPDPAGN